MIHFGAWTFYGALVLQVLKADSDRWNLYRKSTTSSFTFDTFFKTIFVSFQNQEENGYAWYDVKCFDDLVSPRKNSKKKRKIKKIYKNFKK